MHHTGDKIFFYGIIHLYVNQISVIIYKIMTTKPALEFYIYYDIFLDFES